ncbi:hypothetical protein D5018_08650 [Parashewanella curva]|uniref:Opioid growth factor receptor (OGFr) conserved domain-containing protein n=1 Tax=Parashewanella curva TaxID=2338552 RepID=A0A3L8PXM5_9GAMM|nr:opioid growth factor receptor-related protein [Parashewanella curva]RLV60081.1 hypothetical protein D5018_08650 [Parashewanella curva]
MGGFLVNLASTNCCLPMTRSVAEDEIQQIIASTKESSLEDILGKGEKIKDWFCGTCRAKALRALYKVSHAQSAKPAIYAMAELQKYVGEDFRGNFNVVIMTENRYRFTIIVDETEIVLANNLKWSQSQQDVIEPFASLVASADESCHLLEDNRNSLPVIRAGSAKSRSVSDEHLITQHWLLFLRIEDYKGPGCRYTFKQIKQMDYVQLERSNSYIHLLFPASDISESDSSSALLTMPMAVEIQESKQLQQNVAERLDFMLKFWGIQRDGDTFFIADDTQACTTWKKPKYDHNLSRVTLALQFLQQVGFKDCARNLLEFLNQQLPIIYAEGKDLQKLQAIKGEWRAKLQLNNLGYRELNFPRDQT